PVRAVDVEEDPGGVRAVADAVEPARHHPERVVAGEEARDQQDGPPVSARDAAAVEDGIDREARQLGLPAQLVELAPPPGALGLDGRRHGGDRTGSRGGQVYGRHCSDTDWSVCIWSESSVLSAAEQRVLPVPAASLDRG